MKPKLFLHAGTHKTGTTAIQTFCTRNRKELAQRGLLYPKVKTGKQLDDRHLSLAHAFSDAPAKLTAPAAQTALADIARDAKRRGKPVLISAEPIWRHTYGIANSLWDGARDAYISRLAEALTPFDVTLVLVFRRPDNFAKSLFLENSSRGGVKSDFKTYRENIKSRSADYWTNHCLLARHFSKIKCLLYEDLSNEGLITSFFRHLGIDVSDLELPGIVRESINPAEAVLLNILKGASNRGSSRMNSWLENAQVRSLVEEYLDNNRGCDLWESQNARAEYLKQFDAGIEQLRSVCFAGRAQLFDPLCTNDTKSALSYPDSNLVENLTALVPLLEQADALERRPKSSKEVLRAKANELWRSIKATSRTGGG
ncbi:hypothetical protein RA28_16035 [Ruegeria sp. ANG-S4]|nr:hypothetical protein RA28_16035 [Ruegeria sp. ANG-S4]